MRKISFFYIGCALFLSIIVFSVACHGRWTGLVTAWMGGGDGPEKAVLSGQKADSLAEPQKLRFKKGKKQLFLKPAEVARVVCYSFLHEHDYALDSVQKGDLLKVMPGYEVYARKDDSHAKIVLTGAPCTRLLEIMNEPATYSDSRAFCYYPRNCFCFYNKKQEIIGFYEVCFECGRMESTPSFRNSRRRGLSEKGGLAAFCRSAGMRVE